MRWWNRVLVLLAVLSLLAAACSEDEPTDAGGGETAATGTTETTTGTTAVTGPTATGATASGDVTVTTAESDLGEIVVDADGRTLYVFLPDEGGESTCYDECEDAWPPLTVEGEPSGDGVDAELGTVEREDGTLQVTLDGWPLYYFAQDAAPGDVNGQGLNEVWYVVAPDGSTITDAAA